MKTLRCALASFALHQLAVNGSTITSQSFDSREATIDGVHNALFSGIASCRDVVSSFIARIEAFNPTINSIISLNPNALSLHTLSFVISSFFAAG
jgi:hypothetical protein